jgi:hypothetical protein
VDDILIASPNEEDHLRHLETVLTRLAQHGLKAQLNKCAFMQREVTFLGHQLSAEGIRPLASKVDTIRQWPIPKDANALRRFIGVIGFYRRFIPQFADIAAPLQDLVTAALQSSRSYRWDPAHQEAFDNLKTALAERMLLQHPDPRCDSYSLVTDASATSIGAALHQAADSGATPIGLFSKKLTAAQKKYSAFDRELLARSTLPEPDRGSQGNGLHGSQAPGSGVQQ